VFQLQLSSTRLHDNQIPVRKTPICWIANISDPLEQSKTPILGYRTSAVGISGQRFGHFRRCRGTRGQTISSTAQLLSRRERVGYMLLPSQSGIGQTWARSSIWSYIVSPLKFFAYCGYHTRGYSTAADKPVHNLTQFVVRSLRLNFAYWWSILGQCMSLDFLPPEGAVQ